MSRGSTSRDWAASTVPIHWSAFTVVIVGSLRIREVGEDHIEEDGTGVLETDPVGKVVVRDCDLDGDVERFEKLGSPGPG
jgi:hypothetical protein